jgi:hypothetical protein
MRTIQKLPLQSVLLLVIFSLATIDSFIYVSSFTISPLSSFTTQQHEQFVQIIRHTSSTTTTTTTTKRRIIIVNAESDDGVVSVDKSSVSSSNNNSNTSPAVCPDCDMCDGSGRYVFVVILGFVFMLDTLHSTSVCFLIIFFL